jgi:hypothetical protein
MLTLIDTTMMALSESTAIASEAATASISRDEATGALRLLKPVAPGDRVMAGDSLACAGESPACQQARKHARQDCGGGDR